MAAQAAALIAQHSLDDTLYIYDLGNTMRLFKAWRAAMPRVIPYYAVKCNPEPALLKLLAALGAGFDCASKAELETVMGLGVSRDRWALFLNAVGRVWGRRIGCLCSVMLRSEGRTHLLVAYIFSL
jgi:diaminopimelate decarboxylase